MEYVAVAEVDKVPPGQGVAFAVNGKQIAFFNVDGAVFAIDDTCLHQGSSLSAGEFSGKIVTCRRHGWRFDVTTGFVAHVPDYGVACHQVKVEDGKIFVAVKAD